MVEETTKKREPEETENQSPRSPAMSVSASPDSVVKLDTLDWMELLCDREKLNVYRCCLSMMLAIAWHLQSVVRRASRTRQRRREKERNEGEIEPSSL